MKKSSLNHSRHSVLKFGIIAGAALALVCSQNAHAVLINKISEMVGFASGNLGTVGTTEAWNAGSGNVSVTNGLGSLDGTSLGLLGSQGEKAFISGTDGFNTYNLFADGTVPVFRPDISNRLYYSFLYKFHNATFTNGVQRLVQANRQNSSSAYTFQGVARTNNGQIQVGIVKTNGTIGWASTLINPDQTVFLVYRHQIIPPAGSADVCDLWVNPAPGTFGVAEGSIPTPSATVTDGSEDQSNTGEGRFYVASGANAEFDELRISTNWADVTPPVNVCNSAGASAPVPATLALTADNRATFSVVGAGTSPSYQWQVSTNGGGTFNSIPGSGGGTYTTPPLATTDSGNQYRSIVHVLCDNSFATSSVATVTVNPFVVTPPGVIVDDVWADGNRTGINGTGQADKSNSVWYSSSGLLLDASGSLLTGTTRSSNSILWVGYFSPTTNTPVHLAVGTALKVTLPFRVLNVVSNGGNSMRFGLFDYSDGGLRITSDDFGNQSGSTGNGIGVLGYLLVQDFGQFFSVNSPSAISARTTVTDTNLMGASGDFTAIGSGPGAPLFLTNAPAFADGVDYTLDFMVSRISTTSTVVTVSFTGNGTNFTTSVTDTNQFYHRFDSFAMRPAQAELTGDSFTFSRFLVQVVPVSVPFRITAVSRPDASSAAITWDSISGRNYQVQSTDTLSPQSWVTNTTITASSSSTSYTNTGISAINNRFYRVVNTP